MKDYVSIAKKKVSESKQRETEAIWRLKALDRQNKALELRCKRELFKAFSQWDNKYGFEVIYHHRKINEPAISLNRKGKIYAEIRIGWYVNDLDVIINCVGPIFSRMRKRNIISRNIKFIVEEMMEHFINDITDEGIIQ